VNICKDIRCEYVYRCNDNLPCKKRICVLFKTYYPNGTCGIRIIDYNFVRSVIRSYIDMGQVLAIICYDKVDICSICGKHKVYVSNAVKSSSAKVCCTCYEEYIKNNKTMPYVMLRQ